MNVILFLKNIIITLFVVSVCGQVIYAVEIDFNRQIRPILSENCFQCHGPDQSHRKANYRLDTKEGVFAVGKSGTKNILLRDAKNSELVHRIEEVEGLFNGCS